MPWRSILHAIVNHTEWHWHCNICIKPGKGHIIITYAWTFDRIRIHISCTIDLATFITRQTALDNTVLNIITKQYIFHDMCYRISRLINMYGLVVCERSKSDLSIMQQLWVGVIKEIRFSMLLTYDNYLNVMILELISELIFESDELQTIQPIYTN